MRPRTSILIAIFLAGLFVGIPATAQIIRRSVSISGTVHDTDERPLDGIELQLFERQRRYGEHGLHEADRGIRIPEPSRADST